MSQATKTVSAESSLWVGEIPVGETVVNFKITYPKGRRLGCWTGDFTIPFSGFVHTMLRRVTTIKVKGGTNADAYCWEACVGEKRGKPESLMATLTFNGLGRPPI